MRMLLIIIMISFLKLIFDELQVFQNFGAPGRVLFMFHVYCPSHKPGCLHATLD